MTDAWKPCATMARMGMYYDAWLGRFVGLGFFSPSARTMLL